MPQLIAIFFLCFGAEARKPATWDYHLTSLHGALDRGNLYEAKRALSFLRQCDERAYEEHHFDLTAAWIARREDNWNTVYERNEDVALEAPFAVLEMAESLERMGRFREALQVLARSDIRFKGRIKWEVHALRARCHLALNDSPQAVRHLEKLTAQSAPSSLGDMAYRGLIEIYYNEGRPKKARKLAERLQASKPASDAALFTMYLQRAREKPAYLDNLSTLNRFAIVCYRNRDFKASNELFARILEKVARGRTADRARYFLALTHLKQENPRAALTAFQQQMPHLKRGSFEGPAAFQMARTLFMNGNDEETVRFVEDYWDISTNQKWRRECMRLKILALRRLNDHERFARLERALARDRPPNWVFRYYYRNGAIWAMQEGRHQQALEHLERYIQYGLSGFEAQEARLWRGMIQWQLGQSESALELWLNVLARDPNHYFGLVARELVEKHAPETDLWSRGWLVARGRLDELDTRDLKRLYYLAPGQGYRDALKNELLSRLDAHLSPTDANDTDTEALRLAYIGRFDWAADTLLKSDVGATNYHFLKARWHQVESNLYASILHAEILVNSYPRWVPYEMMPERVQRLNYPRGFDKIIREKAAAYQVDPYLLLAIIREESRFNSQAKSWASARGLMQFIPSTAREIAADVQGIKTFSLPMLYDPDTSITMGARYVDKLMETFDGVPLYTVAAYNAGEGAVQRWRGFAKENPVEFVWDVTYKQTKNYCQKVLRAYHHYRRVYEKDNTREVMLAPGLGAL